MYGTDGFFSYLYETGNKPVIKNIEDVRSGRAALRKTLCIDRLNEMSVSTPERLVDESVGCGRAGNIVIKKYEMEILPRLAMPFWILRSETDNMKAVIYCHGHDSNGAKGSFTGTDKTDVYHKHLPLLLAERGYTVIIPELVGFGELQYRGYRQEDQRGCYSNTALALLYGLNIAGLRVFQTIRMIDHAERILGLSDISVFGTSGGGLIAALLGAVDERLGSVIVSNYGASLRKSIMAMHHCIDNYIPGYLQIGEVWDVLSLICPGRLLLTSGANDTIFPLDGVLETAEHVRKVYKRLGVEENFTLSIHNGGHEVSISSLSGFLDM